MIRPAGGDERIQLLQLLSADGGLDVERLQIVAEMAVYVLVIVAGGQIVQLPAEALTAGVVLAGWAPAVPPPIAERFDDAAKSAAIGKNRPALAHRHVVRRIEALRRQVAECAGFPL